MRASVLSGVLFSALIGPVVLAQPLTEKIEVRVVDIDVVVTDHGKPVEGLRRGDFEIFEDGERQPITNFYAIEKGLPRRVDAAAAEQFRRKVLVLIDDGNMSVHGRDQALRQIESMIHSKFESDSDWSIAAVDRRVHLLLPITRDKQAILAALKNARGRRSIQEMVALTSLGPKPDVLGHDAPPDPTAPFDPTSSQNMFDQFVKSASLYQQQRFALDSVLSMAEAAQSFGAIEGKKTILLVTGVLPLGTTNPLGQNEPPQNVASFNRVVMNLRDMLIHEANASNTTVYILGADGLTLGAGSSSMYWIGRETGGEYLPGNRIDQSLQAFDVLSSNFYSLGYRPRHPEDGKYHRITVRVRGRRGYEVHARDGYASVSDEEQLARTLRSLVGVTMKRADFAILAEAEPPSYERDHAVVPLTVSVPMDRIQTIAGDQGSRGRMNIYVSVFDRDGRNLGLRTIEQDLSLDPGEETRGKRIVVHLPDVALRNGSYWIVVAVRDTITEEVGLSVVNITV